jgi:hypothetical protein
MWLQIVGKLKPALTPLSERVVEHHDCGNRRGLTSGMIALNQRAFYVDFDFIDHQLTIRVIDGTTTSICFQARPVADFYDAFVQMLESLDIRATINSHPVECENTIRFEQDTTHAEYDALYAVAATLNSRPRKTLGWRTPAVVRSSTETRQCAVCILRSKTDCGIAALAVHEGLLAAMHAAPATRDRLRLRTPAAGVQRITSRRRVPPSCRVGPTTLGKCDPGSPLPLTFNSVAIADAGRLAVAAAARSSRLARRNRRSRDALALNSRPHSRRPVIARHRSFQS